MKPTRERGRPARMLSRCVPLSLPAMRHPATLPAGVEEMAKAVPRLVRAGRPRSRVGRLLGLGLFCVAFLPGAASAPTGSGELSAREKSFREEILPVFQEHCLRCHGEELMMKELDLGKLSSVLKGSESGPVVVPGKPAESKLYRLIEGGSMPPDLEGGLPEAQRATIKDWIETGLASGPQEEAATQVLNQHDVIPILLRHCTTCHGLRRQGNELDLRSRASMVRGGKSGPALIPGQPDQSLVVEMIRSGKMPPKKRLFEVGVTPVSDSDLEKLRQWILQGAPEEDIEPDVAGAEPDPLVSDRDRRFWAFQPPRQVEPPPVKHGKQVANPIDAFVLRKLEDRGLSLSAQADRLTLIRRATFDLTGLPPEPAEVREFLEDRDPGAYQRLVDRLLESRRYGERWGRYWLDVAGYSDHEGGKVNANGPGRKHAWRYRDYVIRSLNADKPYDRFLMEQIAGDELVDYETAPVITREMVDNLIATGFLRMGPDSTGYELSFVEDRFDVIADEIEILGTGIMGMTLQCARCHSHKFDPIPQRDYFRLADLLKGALDEFDWLAGTPISEVVKFEQRVLPYVPPMTNPMRLLEQEKERKARNEALEEQVKELQQALEEKGRDLKDRVLEERLDQVAPALARTLRQLLKTPEDDRDSGQKSLAKEYMQLLTVTANELKERDALYRREAEKQERKIAWLQHRQEAEPRIRALWDRGAPSPTYLLRRGDFLSPGRLVGPGVPSVLTDGKTPFRVEPPWPGSKKTGRRLALARWLVDRNHPLTARVMVNRIWKHHFGRGIVETLGNFGKSGARPTHPELLDWLAVEFMNRNWSMKALHRLMMTSRTYRQSSRVSPEQEQLDPENRLLSRWPLKRLDGEALRDSLLRISGRLDETPYGRPDPVFVRADGLSTAYEGERGWRRSIYLRQLRMNSPTTLDLFDYPTMNPNCTERAQSTVAPQALHLLNDATIRRLADALAQRVETEAGDGLEAQVERIYWIVLSRPPTAEERRLSLRSFRSAWRELGNHSRERQRVLAKLAHTLYNSAAFVYID